MQSNGGQRFKLFTIHHKTIVAHINLIPPTIPLPDKLRSRLDCSCGPFTVLPAAVEFRARFRSGDSPPNLRHCSCQIRALRMKIIDKKCGGALLNALIQATRRAERPKSPRSAQGVYAALSPAIRLHPP